MKRFIYVVIALTMLMGLFVVPAGAQEKSTVVIGRDIASWTSLDNQYWTYQIYTSEGFALEGLFGYDKDNNIVPKLVETWEQSEDGLTWTFKLREDKKWSNGEPVTAKDFYESWIDFTMDTQAPMWAHVLRFARGWEARGSNDPSLLQLELIDDYTLSITTTTEQPALFTALTVCVTMPNYPPLFNEMPNEWWQVENWVGNGPYMPVEFDPGQLVAYERNPEYVGVEGEDYGNVDRIEFINLPPGGGAEIPAFQAGEIDIADLTQQSGNVIFVKSDPELSAQLVEEPMLGWYGYAMNRGPGKIIDNRNFRMALYMALDRDYLAEDIFQGTWFPAHTYGWALEPRIWDAVEGVPYDPEGAQELMQIALGELGYESVDELPQFVFYTPPVTHGQTPMYEYIVNVWQEEFGLDVILQPMEGQAIRLLFFGPTETNPNVEQGFMPMEGAVNEYNQHNFNNLSDHAFGGYIWPEEMRMGVIAETDQKLQEVDAIAEASEEEWAERLAYAKELTATDYAALFKEQGWEWRALDLEISVSAADQVASLEEQWDEAEDDETRLTIYKALLRLIYENEETVAKFDYILSDEGKAIGDLWDLSYKIKFHGLTDENFADAARLHQRHLHNALIVPLVAPYRHVLVRNGVENLVVRVITWNWLHQFQYLTIEE